MHRTHNSFHANPFHSIFHSFHAERSEHWNGLEWGGMVWSGMEWFGVGWNGKGELRSCLCIVHIF